MPEGHVLHRLASRQRAEFVGQWVRVGSPQGRFAAEAAVLDGRVFLDAQAWGKHLIHRYSSRDGQQLSRGDRQLRSPGDGQEPMVHIHLGIYGRFDEFELPAPVPVGQVRMRLIGDDRGIDLRGPNACELYTPEQLDRLLARLGPDPLRDDADPEQAWLAISRSGRSIGSLLMDQRVVSGVGNIYRAEVLFRAGVSPDRPGRRIGRDEFDAIWHDLVELMRVGERRGAIHVVDEEDDHGAPAYAADRPRTYVYRRTGEECRRCGTPVLWRELEGRNLFWCPTCQR